MINQIAGKKISESPLKNKTNVRLSILLVVHLVQMEGEMPPAVHITRLNALCQNHLESFCYDLGLFYTETELFPPKTKK